METLKVSLRGCYLNKSGMREKETTFLIKAVKVKEDKDDYGTWWTQEKEIEMFFKAEKPAIVDGVYVSVPEKMKHLRKADIPLGSGTGVHFPIYLEEGSTLTIIVPKLLTRVG